MAKSTDRATEVPTVGRVVGENLRRLREQAGETQEEAARRLRAIGLRWQRSHVAAIEAGNRESIELDTAVALAAAFDVPVTELLQGDGAIRLGGDSVLSRAGYREVLGSPRSRWREAVELGSDAAREALAALSADSVTLFQVDAEVAQRLGVRPEDVYMLAEKVWGQTLHQERDRRLAELGEMTAAERRARRGHITRELTREIAKLLEALT